MDRRLALAAAAALAFASGLAFDLHGLALVAKPIPVLSLAAWVLSARASSARWIAAGLALSALGDVALEIRGGPSFFLAGMLAFALAHAAYVCGFLAVSKAPRFVLLLPFGLWGIGLFAFIRPGLGPMAAPVAVYALLLVAMMWRATAAGAPAAALGALLFGLSDSLIATNRFHAPVPGAGWLIMALYWAGQYGIARSVARRRGASV
jgi:uncharacterized membrane protein YhhN